MFKILHEIASNLHSPAACKMYTKIQNPPTVSCYSQRAPKRMKFLTDSGNSLLLRTSPVPSPKATPRFIISEITAHLFLWLFSVILGVSFLFLTSLTSSHVFIACFPSRPCFLIFFFFSVFRCHWFFRELMWAQILSAGPSLMFMLVIRWSSVSSSRAWPSISCSRKASATSLQPETQPHKDTARRGFRGGLRRGLWKHHLHGLFWWGSHEGKSTV